jgi:hypothetical protein
MGVAYADAIRRVRRFREADAGPGKPERSRKIKGESLGIDGSAEGGLRLPLHFTSAYGAAAALVIFLVCTTSSAQILLFCVEMTHVYTLSMVRERRWDETSGSSPPVRP